LAIYSEERLLDNVVALFLIFWRMAMFSIMTAQILLLLTVCRYFLSCTNSHTFVLFLIITMITGLRWCLILVLICFTDYNLYTERWTRNKITYMLNINVVKL
jgi:hypothetical protein